MRTTDDCRFLIGGEDEEFRDPEKRDELLTAKSKKLEKDYEKVFQNDQFITDFSWAGTFGETKDGLPYIGTHPDFKRSYFVLGFGGNGITFSVTGMDMVSDWLAGKSNPLTPYFAFGR
jgi:glycine/D-amino acid oxidase-like deaminating enzyme